MAISIRKDDRNQRVTITGGEETLIVADGVKEEVVSFILAQERERTRVKAGIAQAKLDGDLDARKILMRKYQEMGLFTQNEASKLQYDK